MKWMPQFNRFSVLPLLALWLVVGGCTNPAGEVERVSYTPKVYPLNEQIGATIIYSDSAQPILEIKAGIVQDFGNLEPPYVFFGDGVNVNFYNGTARSASTTLRADTARQLKDNNLWAIGGNVIVRNAKGEEMRTELLYWNQSEEKLYSEANVQIRTDGQLITGKGFEADQEFNTYRIFKVQGEITIDDE